MKNFKVYAFCAVVLLGCSSLAFAAEKKGSISGIIIDKSTKEPLTGATVQIQNTSVGVAADVNGGFKLNNITPGVYTLAVKYISYKTILLGDVRVSGEKPLELNIEMEDDALGLDEVVVTAQRRENTDLSVLEAVKTSLSVVNGISSQQISRSQDSDAAEALRRIPGITIVNDRFIVIRGLSQRYNGVWLNNATTPSTETDSRAFSFDVLPSSLLDNMLVYKSGSANLPADFSGGFVQVLTKNASLNNQISLQYSTTYNTNATFRSFLLPESTPLDALGFGAAKRDLPSGTPSDLRNRPVSDAVGFTRRINNRWGVRSFRAIPDQKLNLAVQHVFDLGSARLSNVTALNYSTGYDYTDMQNNRYQSYSNGQSQYDNKYNDRIYKNTVKLGALFNWSLTAGDNKYEFRNFFNQRGTSSLTRREGHDYYSDFGVRYWESLYTGRTTYSSQVSGEHKPDGKNRIDWTVGYAFAGYNEPDRRDIKSKLDEERTETPYYVDEAKRYYQKLNDNSVSGALNYEHKFDTGSAFTSVLNAGIYGEYKGRHFNARQFQYNMLGSGYDRYTDWTYENLFANENIAEDKIYLIDKTEKCDSYTSDNTTGAGYVSARLNYKEKLTANVGLRVEYYRLLLDGYSSDGISPVNLDQNNIGVYPSLNIAYNLDKQNLFRLTYGRSTNRPEFREIVPYVYYDFDLFANISGNAGLKNAYVNNIDFRYEFYPSSAETVSLGVFYKGFRNPIEQTYHEAGSGVQYTYHNADRAVCYGVELDIKKNLAFMGMEDFSFVLNGSYIYSRIFFAQGAYERNRPMQGQSPYLVNTGLFYQNDKAGFSASALYNVIGKRIETVGIPKQNPNDDIPDVYEMPRNLLDLTVSQKIGKHVEIKGGVTDLLNARVLHKQFLTIRNDDGSVKKVEQTVRSFRPGVDVNIGVTVKF